MPLRTQLHRAISTLLSFQNEDGGIPAVLPGQSSGAWTTASCLESFLLCAYFPPGILENCIRMVSFLITVQQPDGGWPYVVTGPISTLSTGHTLSSLVLAKRYITNQNLLSAIDSSIQKGLIWLEKNQNFNGGWGVQPSLGEDGNLSRISGTYYALRPYWMLGISCNDSDTVKKGANFLLNYQRKDGGWPFVRGDLVDDISEVSNTARAMLALLRSQYASANSEIIQRAVDFLISSKLPNSSWRLGVEGFSSKIHQVNLATATLYHNNSPCDALEALVSANHFGITTRDAFSWLLSSQREDGIWELTSPDPAQHDLERAWTWSTTEFIHVLNLVSEHYLKYMVDRLANGSDSLT